MRGREFDVLVIGAGQGGGPLATAFAGSGRTTALVERAYPGGTCINYGCTPTKTMVASARVADQSRRAGEFGVQTGPVKVDLARVRARKRQIVETFRASSTRSLANRQNLELITGEARFVGERTAEVHLAGGSTRRLRAGLVIIDTGTRPSRPPVAGLDDVPVLDSTGIMELAELPEHLAVLGGGYVGVEFGQMFRRFGSRVTIIHRHDHLLAGEDSDVAEAVAEILRREGVTLELDTEAQRIRPARDKQDDAARRGPGIEIDLAGGQGPGRTIRASHLLVATGRVPNTEALDLAAAGVKTDGRGFIQVDEYLQTTASGVFAVGDVTGHPAFTHVSYDDFRILKSNLLDGNHASTRGRLVPYTVYTDPQLGRVGLTETEASRLGKQLQILRLPMSSVARAVETGQTAGFIKAVIDRKTRRILGCAVLGTEGGEIMSALQIAMMADLDCRALRDAVFAHPTLAEALNNLFAQLQE